MSVIFEPLLHIMFVEFIS